MPSVPLFSVQVDAPGLGRAAFLPLPLPLGHWGPSAVSEAAGGDGVGPHVEVGGGRGLGGEDVAGGAAGGWVMSWGLTGPGVTVMAL